MTMTAGATEVDARQAPRRRDVGEIFGALGVLAACAGLAAVLVVLVDAVGWRLTVRSLVALVILTAVHGGLARLALPRSGTAVRLLVSLVLGLATAGIAVWLSGVFSWFGLRWIAAALPALAWLHPVARTDWRSGTTAADWRGRVRRYGPALWGLAVAWAFAAHSLSGYFAPVEGVGPFREFYVDIPWHIALTAEALDRAPTVYSWIPDVPIGYSWLFFGTLALLGNIAGATAAQLVLMIGPALLAIIVPVALVAAAWTASRSRLAAVIAPLLFCFARAPLFTSLKLAGLTPQWILINRDSTNAMVLTVLVLLIARGAPAAGPGAHRPGSRWGLLLALFLIAFSASGSRGGAVLPILGAVGLAWLVSMLRRDDRATTTGSLAVVVGGAIGATFLVTRSSGSFRIDPMTFLPSGITVHGIHVAAFASVGAMLAMTASAVVMGRWSERVRPALPVLTGAALGGILGLIAFGHPAYSELYFFHAAWPAIVVGLAVVVAGALRALGPLVAVAVAVAIVAAQLLLRPAGLIPATPWPVRAALGAIAVVVVIGGIVAFLARTHGWRRTCLIALPVLTVAIQSWGSPDIIWRPAVDRPVATSGTVSDAQLGLLTELRQISGPYDLVATNKHCLWGTQATHTCDARWFTVAAFAERRVLMEGWSYNYTWTSAGNDNLAPYWNPALLRANDGFIAAPSAANCDVLSKAGVRWIYVDKREASSPLIANYADAIDATKDAALYRLHSSCA